MPEIPVGAQIFDVVFNPTHSTVYTGLLTGHVKAFAYDDQGNHQSVFSVRPSKRSCRGLSISTDGKHLFAVGKARSLNTIDTTTTNVETRSKAHDSPINRVKYLRPWLLSTGDDDGVVKLWDPRQQQATRTYSHHFDYISDFLWLEDKKQLVTTSGDGTLSVIDIRSKKLEPFAQSEDQEDELLSIVAIKGHPHSIDALCSLPPTLTNVDTSSTILTGSSDGFVRAVQLFPTKLLGVIADHGEWPVERIAIGGGLGQLTLRDDDSQSSLAANNVGTSGDDDEREEEEEHQGRRARLWVGSVGHEEVLRLSDLEAAFRESLSGGPTGVEGQLDQESLSDEEDSNRGGSDEDPDGEAERPEPRDSEAPGSDSDSDSEPQQKKRKRKAEKDPLAVRRKKGRNEVEVEGSFFDGL